MKVLYVAAMAFPCVLAASAPSAALAQGTPPLNPWIATWSDEFTGTSLDPAKWMAQNIAWPHNNEQQYYSPSNARVANGMLTITAERRPQGGRNFTSARVETQGRFQQMFGRFEARMKLPRTQSLWPAFWLLPQGMWPPEIDIMEMLGHEPNKVYFSNHYGQQPTNGHLTTSYVGPDFSADFNTFGVEWEPGKLDFFVNGVRRSTHTFRVPEIPMFIILNTAVGGFWPGYPDATTVLPQQHIVDWVRVYKKLDNPGFDYYGPAANQPLWGYQTFGNAFTDSARKRNGYFALKLFGRFTGSFNNSGIFQDMPAQPGQSWRATGWFMHPTNDRLQGENSAALNIEFRDAAGNLLSFVSTRALDAATPVDQYRQVITEGVAPAGTARARIVPIFFQPAMAAGAAFIDDLEFGTFLAPCAADFNSDGTNDFFDYLDFAEAFANENASADFNDDGSIDFFDYLDFAQAFSEGC
ncbi:MAG: glycoside hydrolase family 16 protein [Planctomycetota bacterium]|nr:glycoside hydrolase family 16 protein [Planctomycetota bacterium]